MEKYVKSKEIETKLRWTVQSLMSIVTPLEGKEGPSTQTDGDLDGVLKQLDIITKRVKFGVEELSKYLKKKKKSESPTDKDTKERDLSELLEKEVTENANNVRVDAIKESE